MLAIMAMIIAFIFMNSMDTSSISAEKSQQALHILQSAGFRLSEHLIRKLAHFAEYTVLGFILLLTLSTFTERISAYICYPLFLGLLIPVLDEFIQLFTPGRSSEVRDVLIDFSGSVTGILCGCICLFLLRRLWRKHNRRR